MNSINYSLKGLKLSPLLVCFLAGVVYSLPYYFDFLFFLSFVALTVFFIALLSSDGRKRFFRYSYTFFLGFYFSLYLWLGRLYPFAGFDFTPFQGAMIIAFACVGIPLFHALLHSLIMLLTKLLPDNKWTLAAGFGAAWILAEWIMSLGALAFPWGTVALSQTGFLLSVQTVSLFGSYFIIIVVVCSSMLFALAVRNRKSMPAVLGCIIIAANLITGTILYNIPINRNDSINTAILQGNAASGEKWEPGNLQRIWDNYFSMATQAAENGAELIVLPESAIPTSFYENGDLHKSFARITQEYNVTITAGVAARDSEGSYNSVIAVYPDGSLSQRYDKRHLVPFGEYIPFQSFLETVFPFVTGLNLSGMDTVQGEDSAVFVTLGLKNGSLVCFDSIFDSLSRASVNDNAEILTLVTNDSWFKDSAGIRQHLRHAQLRAIENKRYIIRAANTGISAHISPNGNVLTRSEVLTKEIIYCEVSSVNTKTLYTLLGNSALYAAVAFQLIIIVRSLIKTLTKGIKKHANS